MSEETPHWKLPEYKVWSGMIQRCTNQSQACYSYYGGRGITVWPLWVGRGGFQRFYADVGPRPDAQHTLDRIDNDGNYEPGNVRWATQDEQASNKRSFYVKGEKHGNTKHSDLLSRVVKRCHYSLGMTQKDLSALLGIPTSTMNRMLRRLT